MLYLSTQEGKFNFQTSLLPSGAMGTVTQSNKLIPLTWAKTRKDLEIMSRRETQCLDIVVFCQEVNK